MSSSSSRTNQDSLNSTFFWRAATGRKGVTEKPDRRSLSDDDDKDLEADEKALPGSILGVRIVIRMELREESFALAIAPTHAGRCAERGSPVR